MTVPHVSIVIPARDEDESICRVLENLLKHVAGPREVLVVVDSPDDRTLGKLGAYWPAVRGLISRYPPSPGNAIRHGIEQAAAPVIVVTMADGSDDPRQIPALVALVESGAAVAAASRYMRGGRHIGGPLLKRILAQAAGQSLYLLAGTGTHDATNAYKAYSASFLRRAGIQSSAGLEMGIEMVAKARRMNLRVAEVPTVWTDRQAGRSHFMTAGWLLSYLRWYLAALGWPL